LATGAAHAASAGACTGACRGATSRRRSAPARGQAANWGIADAQANFPMALDEADARLMVVYREPALLAVFDTRSGMPVARLAAYGDTDDLFLDSQRHRLYLSCGAGFLNVIQRHGDSYEERPSSCQRATAATVV
jgi:hypothetical protein